jgi:YjjI family glycine radical enzyme
MDYNHLYLAVEKKRILMTQTKIAYPFEHLETGMTSEDVEQFKSQVRSVIEDPNILEDQKRVAMMDAAFKTLSYPTVSDAALEALGQGMICLLGEGPAPYHPRYVAPDYQKLLEEGSAFFDLKPAEDLHEAITSLLTAYNYSPTSDDPPFIGKLDELLEPYVQNIPDRIAYPALKSFWVLVDRLHPNAFVHADLGPKVTRAGEMLLDIDDEAATITNMTLRYDPEKTPREFALKAVRNALHLSKPYFLNHPVHVAEWGEDYIIASCYNVMYLRGGIFTLVRLNLAEVAKRFNGTLDQLLNEELPRLAELQMEVINSRIRHLVEKVGWFDHAIFVKEDLLDPQKFTAYAGVVGLNELVNRVMDLQGRPEADLGHDDEANQVATQIVSRLKQELYTYPAAYCKGTNGRITFHAQVGISEDEGTTPGCRIPAGTEPDLYTHLRAAAPIQSLVEGGVSDIFEFDQTSKQNPEAVLDIINGAMKLGMRDISLGSTDSEYIRVSGYLVRRCDLENRQEEKLLRHDTAQLARDFFSAQPNTLHRRKRQV